MSEEKIKIESSLLRYARLMSGLSLEKAAKSTGIQVEKLKIAENEGGSFTVPKIEKIANAYKRPFVFFLLNEIPEGTKLPKNFRLIFEADEKNLSSKALFAIRKARYIQEIIQDFSENEFSYQLPNARPDSNPELVANNFREQLEKNKVNLGKQYKLRDSGDALRFWRSIIESLNIFTLQSPLGDNDETKAFCLADKKPFIIFLNSSDHEYSRIFSLIHELGHLVLHLSGICNPTTINEKGTFEYTQIEKFCNHFAGSFLVPKENFIKNDKVQSLLKKDFVTWETLDLKYIGDDYKVSKEVILRRMLTLGMISEQKYKVFRSILLAENKNYIKPKKGDFKIPRTSVVISQNGKAFSNFVINQLNNNKITYSTASSFLNIKPKYIEKIQKILKQ